MILSVDAGTTSIRGILYTDQGRNLYMSQYATSPDFPDAIRVEQDPLVWKQALETILCDCSLWLQEKNCPLEGISLTAFRSPVFPADKKGDPLMPAIMWQDRRTDGLCGELQKESPRIYRTTGLPLTSVFSAVKMLWIARNEESLYRKTCHMAGIYDYLMFLLTGKFLTDESVASRFNLFDLVRKDWDEGLLALFSVKKEHLPEVCLPGRVCGFLERELSSRVNLPSGIPVIAGGGDQQCAALGLGITSPGKAAVNTGTGAYAITLAEIPVPDPKRNFYNNIAAIPGMYILEANMLTAGTIYRWFSETFLDPAEPAALRFSRIDREIIQAPAGANGVILIPHFQGSAVTSGQKGAFLNLGLHTSRGDMARSVLEGIVMEMDEKLEQIENQTGPISRLSASGGMTRFPLYNQIQADIFNRPITAWGNGEATALGAWMNGMMGLGKAADYGSLWESIRPAGEQQFLPRRDHQTLYAALKTEKKRLAALLG